MCVTTEHKSRFKALQSSLHAQCLLCGADHPQELRLVLSTHADADLKGFKGAGKWFRGQ